MEIIAEFKECPYCKVDARLMQSIVDAEIARGNASEGMIGHTKSHIYTNIDTTKEHLVGGRLPSARVYWDICMECGRELPVRIEKGYVTPPARIGDPVVFA